MIIIIIIIIIAIIIITMVMLDQPWINPNHERSFQTFRERIYALTELQGSTQQTLGSSFFIIKFCFFLHFHLKYPVPLKLPVYPLFYSCFFFNQLENPF